MSDDREPTIIDNDLPKRIEAESSTHDRPTIEVLKDLVFHSDIARHCQERGDSDEVITRLELCRECCQEALHHFDPEAELDPEDRIGIVEPELDEPPVSRRQVNRNQLLALAADAVEPNSYGDLDEHFKLIASLWSSLLERYITPAEVVQCMVAVKLARLAGNPAHIDSWTDVAGYAAIGSELATLEVAG